MNPTLKNYYPRPINFQLNLGQSNPEVKFLTQASGYNLLLTPSAAVMLLKPSADHHVEGYRQTASLASEHFFRRGESKLSPTAVVQLRLSGANENPQVLGVEKLPGKVNYFIGNDPDKWHTDIPTYAKVKYLDVYPGIDMIYSGNERQLEWDFIVHPGANPSLISLDFAENEEFLLDDHGNLLVTVGREQIHVSKPVIYQETDHQRSTISGSYIQNDHYIGFQLGDYDPAKPLIIDPIIEYSTYLGGTMDDFGNSIAADTAGNVYVTGSTTSSAAFPPGFPVLDPYQSDNAGFSNAFITKITAAGALVYSTYLGGTSGDTGWSIAIDAAGNAYVTGSTSSIDFPTNNPIQAVNNSGGGGFDVFVTKLNAAGNALIYSTYLGGTQDDVGFSITVDPSSNAYVTGFTQSSSLIPPGFPTKNPMQPDNNSVFPLNDAFVTKINADGTLGYSTYLGGSNNDTGFAIKADAAGNAFVTGSTMSAPPNGFPITPGCFQPAFGGGTDAFVTKLNADGSLGYSSFLGGGIFDEGRGITVDSTDNAYITGYTSSIDFPTKNPFQPSNNGDFDAFVAKVNASGSALVYSTFLGGAKEDKAFGITVDANGYVYVTGSTFSSTSSPPGFPLKNPLQTDNNGLNDAFITRITPDGSNLIFSTYLGGKSNDQGSSIAADSDGNTYVTGFTFSSSTPSPPGPPPGPPGFPVVNPIQANTNGPWDVFVLRLAPIASLAITKIGSPNPLTLGGNLTYQITVTNNGPDPATNVILTDTLPPNVDFISASSGCGQIAGVVTCDLGILPPTSSTTITIVVKPATTGFFTNTATVTSTQSTPVSAAVTTEVILPTANLTITKAGDPSLLPLGDNLVYKIRVTNNGPDTATNVILTDTLPPNVDFISASSGCGQIAGVVTCDLGILPPNTSVPITIVVKPNTVGFFTNTATVTSTQSTPVSATATTEVVPPFANLTISKSGSPNPLPLGQNLTYNITVTNNGPAPATNVILTDTLPPNVDFISASSGCGQIAGVVTCDLGILAPNSSTTVTIIVKPKTAGSFTNTATVTSAQSTPVSATITTTVFTPVFIKFTNITVKRDWQKNPPNC